MSVSATCALIGRWRIEKANIWDRDVDILDKQHLDSVGNAQLLANDLIKIAFGRHGGVKAILKAKRNAFSTSC